MGYFLLLVFIMAIALKSPYIKGYIGEMVVNNQLKKLDPNNYIILKDVLLTKKDGTTTQVDHIVVSIFGVFVIETKNYQGWIFGSEKSQYWTQVIYKRKQKFYNPIKQNKGHVTSIKDLIYDDTIPIRSIIAFSNSCKLKLEPTETKVVYMKYITTTIHSHFQQVMSQHNMKVIAELISKGNMKDRTIRKEHVKQIKTDLRVKKQKINQDTCPSCGSTLVNRKGKYGFFKGCSNYPKCRFVSRGA
ncbi:NERD domain-containing protein [Bacillus sp. NEB1478]|uniref:NERD domain-containing protein n=1 Tax=Bacillus sp. NEB1478 TaxID=3073816 RepID=UPI002873CD30|nr:NERD domain-containing protein [Bacillus sp. NEB1478]WNB91721.1 NERD domain-containing protein [Bacillus sp. NEB1478]